MALVGGASAPNFRVTIFSAAQKSVTPHGGLWYSTDRPKNPFRAVYYFAGGVAPLKPGWLGIREFKIGGSRTTAGRASFILCAGAPGTGQENSFSPLGRLRTVTLWLFSAPCQSAAQAHASPS